MIIQIKGILRTRLAFFLARYTDPQACKIFWKEFEDTDPLRKLHIFARGTQSIQCSILDIEKKNYRECSWKHSIRLEFQIASAKKLSTAVTAFSNHFTFSWFINPVNPWICHCWSVMDFKQRKKITKNVCWTSVWIHCSSIDELQYGSISR